MNIYGESAGNQFTGDVTISGDLAATDGTFENLTVSDTATISTLITQQELYIQDPLITCGVDNPGDNLNLGLLMNSTAGVSGLVRSQNDKKMYMLEATASVAPGDVITNSASYPRADLVCKDIAGESVSLDKVGGPLVESYGHNGTLAVPTQTLSGDTLLDIQSYGHDGIISKTAGSSIKIFSTADWNGNNDSAIQFSTTGGGLGTKVKMKLNYDDIEINPGGAESFTLPTTVGTTGQQLTLQADKSTTWEDAGGSTPTLQEAYDQSTEPQIATTIDDQKLVIKQGAPGLGSDIFEVQNSAGTKRAVIDTTGKFELSGSNASVQLSSSTNVKQWQFRNGGVTDRFELVDAADGEQFSITQAGVVNIRNTLDIGASPDNYSLPSVRGALDQVLRTDGAGVVSWQSLPAQTTPTLQEAFDEGSTITTSLGNSSLLMQQGLTDTTDNMITVRDSGGTDNILIDSDGLIANERSHTKEVSIMDNSKIRRYDIKTDGGLANNLTIQATGGNLLQQTGLTGVTGFYVDNNERLKVTASGIETRWNTANTFIIEDDATSSNKWFINSVPATFEMEVNNADNVVTQKTTQTGETVFSVGGAEKVRIWNDGISTTGANILRTRDCTIVDYFTPADTDGWGLYSELGVFGLYDLISYQYFFLIDQSDGKTSFRNTTNEDIFVVEPNLKKLTLKSATQDLFVVDGVSDSLTQYISTSGAFLFTSTPSKLVWRYNAGVSQTFEVDGLRESLNHRHSNGNILFKVDGDVDQLLYQSSAGQNLLNINAVTGKTTYKNTSGLSYCEIDANSRNFQLKKANGDPLLSVVDSINSFIFGAGSNSIFKTTGGNNSNLTFYHTAQPVLQVLGSSKILNFQNAGTNLFQINGTTNNVTNGDNTLTQGNSALTKYVLPANATGATDGDILSFKEDTRDMVWNSGIDCNTTWGGKLDGINKFLVPWGDGGVGGLPNTIDATVESMIFANCYLMGFAYSSLEGDATTRIQLYLNGVASVELVAFAGAQGVFDFVAPVSLTKGDRIAFRLQAGTPPKEMNAHAFTKFRNV